MYNSPTTPGGTGRNRPSRTYTTRVRHRTTDRHHRTTRVRTATTMMVANVVVSSARTRRHHQRGHTSPHPTHRNPRHRLATGPHLTHPARQAGACSATTSNRGTGQPQRGHNHAPRPPAPEPTRPGSPAGATTTAPTVEQRHPQLVRRRVERHRRMQQHPLVHPRVETRSEANATTLRCVTTTPLGTPVDPTCTSHTPQHPQQRTRRLPLLPDHPAGESMTSKSSESEASSPCVAASVTTSETPVSVRMWRMRSAG